jgi:hypothetical protein
MLDPLEAPTIDVRGECFEGAAFLACAYYRAAWARRGQCELLRAIESARVGQRDQRDQSDAKAATANLAEDVIVEAVDLAMRSLSRSYVPERHFRAIRERDRDALAWLAREWDKRKEGESAEDFAKRAVSAVKEDYLRTLRR